MARLEYVLIAAVSVTLIVLIAWSVWIVTADPLVSALLAGAAMVTIASWCSSDGSAKSRGPVQP